MDAATIVGALACGRAGCSDCTAALRASAGRVHCPAHDDDHPSLSVAEKGGRTLVRCHADCPQPAVIDALRRRGLWAEPVRSNGDVRRWLYVAPNGSVVGIHARRDPPGERKRMWFEHPDGTPSKGGAITPRDLPLYNAPALRAAPPDTPVLLVEGEPCADAASARGFVAVSLAGGAGQTDFGTALDDLRGRDVVLLPDNDDPGRRLMQRVAAALAGVARSVRTLTLPDLPPAGDIVDWFAAGGTADTLPTLIAAASLSEAAGRRIEPVRTPQVTVRNAVDLLAREFPDLRWAVPGLIVEGLTILAGAPKLGKSWLALGMALAIAAGGRAIGATAVDAGEALYLGLEDSERRLQRRVAMLLEGAAASPLLSYATDWPRLDHGGGDALDEWLTGHPSARLVVIDTLKRVRAREDGRANAYAADYDALVPLASLAQRHRVAILVVHHVRKLGSDDPLDLVSGTTGLTGAADAVLVLRRARGSSDGTLYVTGRDVEEHEYAMSFDATRGAWTLVGDAAEHKRSETRRQVIDALSAAPEPMTPKAVADATGLPYPAVKQLLWRAGKDGAIAVLGNGTYAIAPSVTDARYPRYPVTEGADSRLQPAENGSTESNEGSSQRVTMVPAVGDGGAAGNAGNAAPSPCVTRDGGPTACNSRLQHGGRPQPGNAVTRVTQACPECGCALSADGVCWGGCGYGRACADCGYPTGHPTWPRCDRCTAKANMVISVGGGK